MDSLMDFWDNIKCTNILIVGFPKREEREKEAENSFKEIIAENFPILEKKSDMQVQKAQRVPGKMDPEVHWDIIIKTVNIKDKEKILKAQKKTN